MLIQYAIDWRSQLRRNQRRTRIVVATFILLYLLLGFLIDILITTSKPFLSDGTVYYLTIGQATHALLTGQVFPTVTLITSIVAIVSLIVTYSMYDKIMLLGTEYYEIKPGQFRNEQEQQLYNVVEEMKIAAGLRYMPRVFLIEADYMNAFASGYSERSAMVAITRGLCQKLDRSELQAVMAHELSHIRHQDIKLTLMASVLSNLMLMIIDICFYSVIYGRSERKGDNKLVIVIILLRFILPLITILLMLYLSRTREYMADIGCVELTRDNEPLARALLKIHQDHTNNQTTYTKAYKSTAHEGVRRAAYIYDPSQAGISAVDSINSLFSTHPPIKERLKALGVTLPGN